MGRAHRARAAQDWFANEVEVDLRPGGAASFRWSNGEERHATVTTVAPEERLAFAWEDEGEVEFTLLDDVDGTRLVVVETVPAWTTALDLQAPRWRMSTADPLGQVFSALADPSRRHVMDFLAARGTATATELTGELPITRQAVSKHLATLAGAGLVSSERRGRETRYRLTVSGREWDERLGALADHLERRRSHVNLYERVRELPLRIDEYALEPLEREVARGFTLRRTVVVLRGDGHEGRGEEVDYDPGVHQRFQERSRSSRSSGRTRSTRSRSCSRARPTTGAGPSSRPHSTSRCARRAARSPRRSGARRSR